MIGADGQRARASREARDAGHVDAQALRAGASGFDVKHAAGKELIAAIRTVRRRT